MASKRFEVTVAVWDDVSRVPVEWAVWDNKNKRTYGKVTWKSKQTAQGVVKMLNSSDYSHLG